MEKIEITEQEKGVRLDIFLTELEPLSRSAIKNLITIYLIYNITTYQIN